MGRIRKDPASASNIESGLRSDLDAMRYLQKLGNMFVREETLNTVLGAIIESAIAIADADFGNIQLYDSASGNLHIAAQSGFPPWWVDYWNEVHAGKGACGTAMGVGKRVIIDDVENSPIFVGTEALDVQLRAGVRAVQSTPLISRSGKLMGMFSTHYKQPHHPDRRSLLLLDLLARQASDIIDRFQSDEELRHNKRKLDMLQQQQVAIQTALALAHDLNQPLTAIASYSHVCLKMLGSPTENLASIQEIVEHCEEQALRAGGYISDLLALLAIEDIPAESFNLNQEILEVLSSVQKERDYDFRTRLNLAKRLRPVTAIRLHIQKALSNLMRNSIEAMMAANTPSPEISISTSYERDQQMIRVTIRDNGPGICEENTDRIFAPFYTTKDKGIGFGLSISKKLIEYNDGKIWLDTTESPGATFHILIPLKKPRAIA